jgi:hypothetical protein
VPRHRVRNTGESEAAPGPKRRRRLRGLGALGSVVTMNDAIWCVAYGLLWWWVALMLPDRVR